MYIAAILLCCAWDIDTGGKEAVRDWPAGVFLFFCFSLNPFAIEEKGDLNRLYLTLPVKRNSVVAGRYLLSLLMLLCGLALGMLFMPLANQVALSRWYPDLRWMLAVLSFSFLFYALMSLFMYPLLFRLGYQKGKYWGMYLPIGVLGGIFCLVARYDEKKMEGKLILNLLVFAGKHMLLASGGMFLLAVLLLAASFWLSCRGYARREF